MLNPPGNVLDENIPITIELLDFAINNNIKICLKTGFYNSESFKSPKRAPYNLELLTSINALYLNGGLYPKKYSEAFNIPKFQGYLISIMKDNGLKTLSRRESQGFYGKDIERSQKDTMLRKYGAEHNNHLESSREKRRQTSIRKYGVDSPFKSDVIKEKIRKTNIERHGVDNVFKSPELQREYRRRTIEKYGGNGAASPIIRERMKETNLKRHGIEYPIASKAVREKIAETFIEKYGIDNPFKSPEVQTQAHEKVRAHNMAHYGVEYLLQSPVFRDKAKVTCMSLYGVEYPMQSKAFRDKANDTMLSRYGTHRPLLDPEKGEFYLERYYKLCEFREAKRNGTLNTNECRDWILNSDWSYNSQLAYLKELCGKESYNYTSELFMESILDSIDVQERLKFIRNAKKAHGVRNDDGEYYEMDFYYPKLKLGIEVNGLAYHSTNMAAKGDPTPKDYHFRKFLKFHKSGIKMISFTDYEMYNFKDDVISIIKYHLKLSETVTVSKEFLEFNKIDNIEQSLNYGMFDESQLSKNFENHQHQRFIGRYDHWDCGVIKC